MADTPIIIQAPKLATNDSSDTSIIVNPNSLPIKTQSSNTESHIFRISIRSLLAIILTGSLCALVFLKDVIPDVLANLVVMAVSFYFGAKSSSNGASNIK